MYSQWNGDVRYAYRLRTEAIQEAAFLGAPARKRSAEVGASTQTTVLREWLGLNFQPYLAMGPTLRFHHNSESSSSSTLANHLASTPSSLSRPRLVEAFHS